MTSSARQVWLAGTADAERNGQLEIRRWEDAYLIDGRFDQYRMLALIEEVLMLMEDRGQTTRE